MAFILATGAVLRMMAARADDPLVVWIEAESIRPFIATTTMALARHEYRLPSRLPAVQQAVFEERFQRLTRDLRTGRQEQITEGIFDTKTSEILSDILLIDAGRDALSDMDLVPAAIAMQHNLDLVIADAIEPWQALSDAIPPELGRLALKVFAGETS